MTTKRFTLTEKHVKLARQLYVWWDRAESGAPSIDPKRPYGSSGRFGVTRDVHRHLGWPIPEDENECERYFDGPGYERAFALHKEMEVALQVILAAGSFEPGIYEAREYWHNDWKRVP